MNDRVFTTHSQNKLHGFGIQVYTVKWPKFEWSGVGFTAHSIFFFFKITLVVLCMRLSKMDYFTLKNIMSTEKNKKKSQKNRKKNIGSHSREAC